MMDDFIPQLYPSSFTAVEALYPEQIEIPDLRDQFAMAALTGICAHADTWGLQDAEIAAKAFNMADLLIAARIPVGEAACVRCGGTGEIFGHDDACNEDNCALNGDIDSCQGEVSPCPECSAQMGQDKLISELLDALEPFAKEAGTWLDTIPDAYRSLCTEPGSEQAIHGSETEFNLGDLRRAAALVERARAQGGAA